jgi:hypothetical protein
MASHGYHAGTILLLFPLLLLSIAVKLIHEPSWHRTLDLTCLIYSSALFFTLPNAPFCATKIIVRRNAAPEGLERWCAGEYSERDLGFAQHQSKGHYFSARALL